MVGFARDEVGVGAVVECTVFLGVGAHGPAAASGAAIRTRRHLRPRGFGESYSAASRQFPLNRCDVVESQHAEGQHRSPPADVHRPLAVAPPDASREDTSVPPDAPAGAPPRPRARAAFLAEAARLLSESLDYESILQQLADAAVPALADWCAVDVVHSQAAGEWPPVVRRVAV